MGRRTRIREYDEFLEKNVIVSAKDDRSRANRVRNEKDLQRLTEASKPGVIAQKIKQLNLLEYKPDGTIEVRDKKVQQEADQIKQEVLSARFLPLSESRKEYREIAEEQNISEEKAKNIVARNYAIRAKAILTAAKADDVKIDRYTVGLLNGLEKGDYERVIYGKKDSSGERRFSRGRFFTELGFDRAEKRKKEGRGFVGTEAKREELRQTFLEYTGGRGFGDRNNQSTAGRTGFTSAPAPQKKTESRFASFRRNTETKEERNNRFSFDEEENRRKSSKIEVPF